MLAAPSTIAPSKITLKKSCKSLKNEAARVNFNVYVEMKQQGYPCKKPAQQDSL